MERPEILGTNAAACIAEPAVAASALGSGVAEEVIISAAYCYVAAVVADIGVSAVL